MSHHFVFNLHLNITNVILFAFGILLILVPEYAVGSFIDAIFSSIVESQLFKGYDYLKNDFEFLKDMFGPLKKIINRSPLFYFVLHMGALGSALITTRTFVGKRNEKSYFWYIYRPLQGMLMAALLIYGLSAGMIGVNANTELMDIHDLEKNRYTIGFLSALAGIFAEDALRALARISKTIFGVRERKRLRPRKDRRNNNKSTTKYLN